MLTYVKIQNYCNYATMDSNLEYKYTHFAAGKRF